MRYNQPRNRKVTSILLYATVNTHTKVTTFIECSILAFGFSEPSQNALKYEIYPCQVLQRLLEVVDYLRNWS